MRRASVLVLTLATAAPAIARAQSITPTFAWPVGATAEVTTSARTSQTIAATGGMSREDTTGVRTQATLTVSAHPEGLSIATTGVSAQGGNAAMSSNDVAMLTQLGGNFIVTKAGAFVRLSEPEKLKARMDSVLAPSLAQVRASAPAMADNMARLSSIEFLTQSAQQNWLQMAGGFVGRSWAPGDSATATVLMPFPLSSTGTLSLPRVTRYDGVVPCPDQRRGTCWQFTSRQLLSRETLRAPLLEMLRQMGAPEGMIDQMPIPETTTTTTHVFDAATLLPLRTSTNISGGAAGPLAAMLQSGATTVSYRWK